MATVNILQGSLKGSIGQVTGSVWKGKPTIRSKPFSKKPHTEIQTANVRAFEKLNRIASGLAKTGFARLGVSGRNLHKHNAVARWLKPAIRNHIFEPKNISEVIPYSNNFCITRFFYNHQTNNVSLNVNLYQGYTVPNFTYLHLIVFDDTGNYYFTYCDVLKKSSFNFFVNNLSKPVLSVLAFASTPQHNKRICNNLIYKRGNIMRYSIEEQQTGDIWMNGRPIYQRTIVYSIPASTGGSATSNFFTFDEDVLILEIKQHQRSGPQSFISSTLPQYPKIQFGPGSPYISPDTFFTTFSYNSVTRQLSCNLSTTTRVEGGGGTITVFYTKSSDQPVVD